VAVTTDPTNLAVSVTYNGKPDLPVNAGSYAVIARIADPAYSGEATGMLVVSPALGAVTLDPASLSQTYDGTARSVTFTTDPSNLVASATYNGSADAPVNAGSYTVVASIADPNYSGSATNTLLVGRITPDVTAWPMASALTYGQTLASSLLYGGDATPAGSFAFTAPAAAPNAGEALQGVVFTPDDAVNYVSVTGSVSVTVSKTVIRKTGTFIRFD
jgi:hypothetical protein